ncbi:hypothetical protein FC83_GL003098 [Agrilactobacillus composti DSM 18527 = JCM 14202]|uniref:Uncharacterized protein n=2 Tax=Agrilactobacillus TaxID=2767875 RepID=A0A0R1XSV9_9LACO|nr:hypothetical protein FC83_GL003098 [Agrilactobacillus composti DSM 18527 = JCM 14202]
MGLLYILHRFFTRWLWWLLLGFIVIGFITWYIKYQLVIALVFIGGYVGYKCLKRSN